MVWRAEHESMGLGLEMIAEGGAPAHK
jgi:hypothetical protein